MHHVAIMNKSWKLIPKILSGEKTIESRWYQTKRSPWNKAKTGDTVYFKNSGEPVTAKATVTEVLQFALQNFSDVQTITQRYGKQICLVNPNPKTWDKLPKYCILLKLSHPKIVAKPWKINKKGYGAGAAWISIKNISDIRM
jgi:ASC-1-like (ASCH) protein